MSVVSLNPSNPSDVVVDVGEATRADVTAAVGRLRDAQTTWAGQLPQARSGALINVAEKLAADAGAFADLIVREVGKPGSEAAGEVQRSIDILRYASQQSLDESGATHNHPTGLSYTLRRPKGVAGLITPWNFPLAIPLWKAAPALAHGNTVALKPAPQATGVALALAGLFDEAILEVLPGFREAGEAVIDTTDVVSFTGSVATGQSVIARAAARGIAVQAEMGGCNATVVLPDADLDMVARDLVVSCFSFAGQKCTATQRIIAVGDKAPLVAKLRALMATLDAGPVIDDLAQKRLVEAGCSALDRDGYFVAPTLVETDDRSHTLLNEEVFGPIAAIISVDSTADAVALADAGKYGLVTSVYTNDLTQTLGALQGSTTGLLRINQPTTGVDFHLPFGGQRNSSYGPREQGTAARDHYTWLQTISIGGHA